jgi:hypothetical protein
MGINLFLIFSWSFEICIADPHIYRIPRKLLEKENRFSQSARIHKYLWPFSSSIWKIALAQAIARLCNVDNEKSRNVDAANTTTPKNGRVTERQEPLFRFLLCKYFWTCVHIGHTILPWYTSVQRTTPLQHLQRSVLVSGPRFWDPIHNHWRSLSWSIHY